MLRGERPQQHGRQIDHAHALERSRHFPSLFQSLRLAIGDLVEPMAFAVYTISGTLATTTASWTALTSMPLAFAVYTISGTLATTTASWTALTSMPFRF